MSKNLAAQFSLVLLTTISIAAPTNAAQEKLPVQLSQSSPATVETLPVLQSITSERAIQIIAGLPEVRYWRQYITSQVVSGRAASVEASSEKQTSMVKAVFQLAPKPVTIANEQYWSIGFYESHPTHQHRWQSFWVSFDGYKILVDDDDGKSLPLGTWRYKAKPLQRVNLALPIHDGLYQRGLDKYLQVKGDRYRYQQAGVYQPWQSVTGLKAIDADTLFDGQNYWERWK
jgi:hypothetical protein